MDVIVASVLPNLTWIKTHSSDPSLQPESRKLLWQQQLEYLEPADRWCNSATMDGSTRKDLLAVTMNESASAQGFTFSSAPFDDFNILPVSDASA